MLLLTVTAQMTSALRIQKWQGNLDEKGGFVIEIPAGEGDFIVQGFILLKENWREINIFYDEKRIWAQLGPSFKNLPYRVRMLR